MEETKLRIKLCGNSEKAEANLMVGRACLITLVKVVQTYVWDVSTNQFNRVDFYQLVSRMHSSTMDYVV